MASMASIDDLFRQKTLQEIHGVLKQTRAEVEAKKQELRELVGDHYRSVLESSDHIRAMSECAAKVSSGADHIEELIASMRSLSANPPTLGAGSLHDEKTQDSSAEGDHEYRVSLRVMELLEVPDTVSSHLNEHQFVLAARMALVDAITLQTEVDDLLRSDAHSADSSPDTFNFGALARQQAATFRSLPSQISASCEDAFSSVSLDPGSAAESFAVRLVLDTSMQPTSLLHRFLEHRRELIRSLLHCDSQGAGDASAVSARLASAAVAYEGTVVLGASLCQGSLEAALAAVYEGAPEKDALEERAAIQGQSTSGTGFSSLRKRGESLGLALRQGGSAAQALLVELGERGSEIAREWAPPDSGGASCKSFSSSGSGARGLSTLFFQFVSSDDSMRGCKMLGETLTLCSEKVLGYRRVLSKGSTENWSTLWAAACSKFCPGRPQLDDALSVVTAAVEAACIEVARERVGDLQLDLVPTAEDDGDALDAAAAGDKDASDQQGSSEVRRHAEVAEMQRQSHLRVQRLDEQLGEILEDLGQVALPGGDVLSPVVSGALLEALCQRLKLSCENVRLPAVMSLWPLVNKESGSESPSSWPRQRGAARAAIAFDALLSAAVEPREGEDTATSHLRSTLRTAVSSGDSGLMRHAQGIFDELQQRSDLAYNVWSRLAVSPSDGIATLEAYWRLADDEVAHACGWGNAKFMQKGGGSDESSKAVPVPVQASSFVFERLTLGARRAFEVSGGISPMPRALVVALKASLCEAFMAAFEARPVDFATVKHTGMSHLLQWLFDLRFLQITLSSAVSNKAYEALCALHDKVEATTLSDPVDRLLYQEVLKSAVKGHIEGVKILLGPFFQHNPRYGFLFPGQGTGGVELSTFGGATSASAEDDGFELQTTFAPPLRPMLPQRFPLLPVAMTSALTGGNSAELDVRLGLSADSAERAAARMSGANPGAPSVSSLIQTGLGTFGFGKALFGGPGGTKPPQAV
jgi:hypothetical protein